LARTTTREVSLEEKVDDLEGKQYDSLVEMTSEWRKARRGNGVPLGRSGHRNAEDLLKPVTGLKSNCDMLILASRRLHPSRQLFLASNNKFRLRDGVRRTPLAHILCTALAVVSFA
jgi:hypothetical protein